MAGAANSAIPRHLRIVGSNYVLAIACLERTSLRAFGRVAFARRDAHIYSAGSRDPASSIPGPWQITISGAHSRIPYTLCR